MPLERIEHHFDRADGDLIGLEKKAWRLWNPRPLLDAVSGVSSKAAFS